MVLFTKYALKVNSLQEPSDHKQAGKTTICCTCVASRLFYWQVRAEACKDKG